VYVPSRARNWTIAIVVVLLTIVARLAVVASWHAPAGDGHQYYHLSQTLISDGRFAYGPAPQPLAWSRLPGYPLFLALIAVRSAPLPMEAHLVRATQANALLDVGTALLAVALLRRRRARPLTQALAYAFVVFCPPLVYLSCYGLTESLATFLFVLEIALALRIVNGEGDDARRPFVFAALAGIVAGLAQLTRVDALTAAPAALVAIYYCGRPRRTQLLLLGTFGLAAALTFAPWPLRNLRQFGAPHMEGTEWLSQSGAPLPNGVMKWMRSWSGGEPGGSYSLLRIANGASIDPRNPGMLLPRMYDDAAERAQLVAILERYNRQGLSPDVDRDLEALANQRAHAHPLRQNLILPARRFWALWSPLPEYELPVRSRLLHLPAERAHYDDFLLLLIAAALPGAAWMWRRDRTLALALLLPILFRSILHARFAHPCPTQRYVVELMPSLMILAAEFFANSVTWLASRRARASAAAAS
jgi:hypothetical protein